MGALGVEDTFIRAADHRFNHRNLSDNEQGHSYVVICRVALSPPPPPTPAASHLHSLLCLFSHQLLINSSRGISCLPPSLSCSCSKWNSILALFTKHQLLNTPQLSRWICKLTSKKVPLQIQDAGGPATFGKCSSNWWLSAFKRAPHTHKHIIQSLTQSL